MKFAKQQEAQLEFDVASSLWLPKGAETGRSAGMRVGASRREGFVGSQKAQTRGLDAQRLELEASVIFEGDALAVLRQLPSQSVQCMVTSPPYWGLRDYHIPCQIGLERTLSEFLASLRAVFAEARRVLRDDGIFWLNIGDGYTSGNRGWRAPDKKNRARAMAVRPDILWV